jgi:hypothetical protein
MYLDSKLFFSLEGTKMQKRDIGFSMGGGIIVIVVVALLNIFVGKQAPMDGVKDATVKAYTVSLKADKLCDELAKITTLTDSQKDTIAEAKKACQDIEAQAQQVAKLLSIQLETPAIPVDATVVPPAAPEIPSQK